MTRYEICLHTLVDNLHLLWRRGGEVSADVAATRATARHGLTLTIVDLPLSPEPGKGY